MSWPGIQALDTHPGPIYRLQQYPDVVRAVDPGDSFVRECEQFVDRLGRPEGAKAIAVRAREVAKQNDWNVIAETFWRKVLEMMGQ